MTTKTKKSDTMKFLEKVAGGPLTFGGLLEAIRDADEVSQAEFARQLGISRSHLNDIEKGRKSVSAARASEFAAILEYSPTQFIRLALQDEIERAGLHYKVSLAAG